MKKIFIELLFLGLFSSSLMSQDVSFYVSQTGNDSSDGKTQSTAFATIERAQHAVREVKAASGNITSINVYIKGGNYELSKPLIFKPEDSGKENMQISYQPVPGEKVQISGGKPIAGWKKWKNGIWQTNIPAVREGKWYFEQIWVNGETRRRAHTPDTGFFRVKGFPGGLPSNYQSRNRSFEYSEGDLNPHWTNLKDVMVIVYHFWTDSHMLIDSATTIPAKIIIFCNMLSFTIFVFSNIYHINFVMCHLV